MKKITLLSLLLFTSSVCFGQEAQDTIVLKNGKKIVGKVISVKESGVIYTTAPEKKDTTPVAIYTKFGDIIGKSFYKFQLGLSIPTREYGDPSGYGNNATLPSNWFVNPTYMNTLPGGPGFAAYGGHFDARMVLFITQGLALTAKAGLDINPVYNNSPVIHANGIIYYVPQGFIGIYIPLYSRYNTFQLYLSGMTGLAWANYPIGGNVTVYNNGLNSELINTKANPGSGPVFCAEIGARFGKKKIMATASLAYVVSTVTYQWLETVTYNSSGSSSSSTNSPDFNLKMGILQLSAGISLRNK